MAGAIHHHPAAPAKADLQLDLVAVRVLALAGAGCDRLVAHRERVEAGERGRQPRIGVAVGGHGLPVRWSLSGLDDDGAAFHGAHDVLPVYERMIRQKAFRTPPRSTVN